MHPFLFAFVLRRILLVALLFFPQRFWFRQGWQLGWRVRAPFWRRLLHVVLIAAAALIVLVLADRIAIRFLPEVVSVRIAPLVQLWVFTSTFAFFCMKAVAGAAWLWTRLRRKAGSADTADQNSPSRRRFLRYATSLAAALPAAAAIYGYARGRLRFETVRVDVPIKNLPAELDGLRIVQLSDIHIGDYMPREEIRRAVDMANSLSAHLAVVTGDFLTSEGDPLADCIGELSRLSAPLGVWGCNGNHEIYADAEDAAEDLFRNHNMTLLRQSATQLHWNGAAFNLLGVDYQRQVQLVGSTMPTLSGVESLVRPDMVNILLSHNPNTFYRAAEAGVELSLAGHTHGGQINVEILNHSLSPARFMTDFIAGLYQLPMPGTGAAARTAFLYVNRGIGTLGIPARIGADPEITLLTLRRDG